MTDHLFAATQVMIVMKLTTRACRYSPTLYFEFHMFRAVIQEGYKPTYGRAIMTSNFITRIQPHLLTIGMSFLLSTTLSLSAHATEVWKINFERNRNSGRLVILLFSKKPTKREPKMARWLTQRRPQTLLWLLPIREFTLLPMKVRTLSMAELKKVDYGRWKSMKVVQIGDHARSADYCDMRCQSGFNSGVRTITFATKGVDLSQKMGGVLVLNTR